MKERDRNNINEEFRNLITTAAENKIGVRGNGGRKREGMRGWNKEIEKGEKDMQKKM